LIKIKVKDITGFAIHPNIGSAEIADVIAVLPEKSRLAFVDLTPSREAMELISKLEEAGHAVVCYLDHHLDPRRQIEMVNVRKLEVKFGDWVKIVTRQRASSCPKLVDFGQWENNGVTAVFFHADFDGFLSFLKGCGVNYPELEADADILDGAARGRRLSAVGKLLADAHEHLVPAYSQNPAGHHSAKQRIYQIIADWIAGGCQSEELIQEFAVETRQATEEATMLALRLVEQAELLLGNVVLCDFLPAIKTGKQINISLWKREVLRRFGTVLLCSVGTGHMGEQVYIELPRAWQGQIDLRDFLPKGVQGRIPTRVQVPLARWEEFLEKWRNKL